MKYFFNLIIVIQIDGINFGPGDTFNVPIGAFSYFVKDANLCQKSNSGTMSPAAS
jgi:hypothetical protein